MLIFYCFCFVLYLSNEFKNCSENITPKNDKINSIQTMNAIELTEDDLEALAEALDPDFVVSDIDKQEENDEEDEHISDSNDDDDDESEEMFDEYFCDACDKVPHSKILMCLQEKCDFVACEKCKKTNIVQSHTHQPLYSIPVFTDYFYVNDNEQRQFHVITKIA